MARDLSTPLAVSLFDDDKPKKKKKVKSGGTKIKTEKSKKEQSGQSVRHLEEQQRNISNHT